MGRITKLKESSIEDMLTKEGYLRNIGFELVRQGRRINSTNFINEIVYEEKKVIKDKENLPAYRNNEILTKDGRKKTIDVFVEEYGEEKKEFFKDINNTLISRIFGENFIELFNYSQRKLNQTKKQRIGGEGLKDAYIFVHTFRTVEILKDFGATEYQIRLGFLHDIIEELRDWRIKKKKDNQVKSVDEEKRLNEEIKSAPEYKEIYDMLVKTCKSEGKENISEEEARLTDYHLRLITRRVNESYKKYAKRIGNGCFKEKSKKKIRKISFNEKDQKDLYTSPLIVKLADSIDNTIRVREGDISDRIKRLNHNLYIIKEVDKFLYHSKSDIMEMLKEKLINVSINEIEKNMKDFEGDNDPAVKVRFKIFKELADDYGPPYKHVRDYKISMPGTEYTEKAKNGPY